MHESAAHTWAASVGDDFDRCALGYAAVTARGCPYKCRFCEIPSYESRRVRTRSVDAVVVFEDDTPLALVNSLQPDVLVKGGDYDAACTDENDPRYMVGSAEVKAWGGHAVAVPLVPGQSTTATLKKIRTS